MMKRWKKLAAIFVFCIAFVLCGYTRASGMVYDEAELFNERELLDLNEQAEVLSHKFKTQVIVVTLQQNYGDSIGDFAKEYYKQNKFGFENGGIMLLIDLPEDQQRAYYIYHERGYVNNKDVKDIGEEIMLDLSDGDYYGAANQYLELIDQYASLGINGEADKKDPSFLDSVFVRLGISVLVSGVIVLIMIFTRNHDSKPAGQTYLSEKGVKINQQSDQFSHTTVIQRKIEKQSDNKSSGGNSGGSSGGYGGTF